ncbi:cytochrome P450 [Amycolatopsis nigrescens]|uniref:cytochrome P450 n=1 Tax=Amycolatopsis nigrescens TaxID=381445 RepID=UPI001B7FDB4B|nr:cytochrome P450 [Amycolatopsis nigrescens]
MSEVPQATGVPGRFPPGPRLPATLQGARWLLGSSSFLERCHQRYGDLFTLDLAAKAALGPAADRSQGRWVFVADPAHVKRIFTADPAVVRTGATNRFLEPLVGPRSILVQDEPEHRDQRKLLLPPLHGERLRGYGAVMSEAAEAELCRWPVGEPFALWPRMQAITLEVIVRTVFGITEPSRLEHVTRALRTMLDRMTNPRWLFAQGLLATIASPPSDRLRGAARRLVGPVEEVILDEIRRRRAMRDLNDRTDLLSMLVQAEYQDGSPMSDRELRDELMTLLIAGHESTATALAWAFELLLRHPEKLARLRDETGSDEYADAVVKETLRLRPVVPFVLRCLNEPMELGGHSLPAGTWLAPCAYLVHRRPDCYPEPLAFRPERFLDQPAGAYTWLPFGGGGRRCLGAGFAQLEMTRVLQSVVSRAELVPAKVKPEEIRARFITLAPARGTEVVLRRRMGVR